VQIHGTKAGRVVTGDRTSRFRASVLDFDKLTSCTDTVHHAHAMDIFTMHTQDALKFTMMGLRVRSGQRSSSQRRIRTH
jgi:hypothetical protein